jgi:hypothetical protein
MDELLKTALVGTARHPGPPLDPGHEAEALLATLPPDDQEHHLLMRVGVRSLYQQCGQIARHNVPKLEAAPGAGLTLLSRRWVDVLRQAMLSNNTELLLEFLRALKETQVDVPHELLPVALGLSDREVREALLPVLGDRGRWLSQFDPAWGWVTRGVALLSSKDHAALQESWEEGQFSERCQALSLLRQSQPEEARQWLEQVLPKEKAERRAVLVEQLLTGLTLNDEPLLERLLDDRSDQVRVATAVLLRKLAGSQFIQRMLDRGEHVLRVDPKAKPFKLTCTPPEEIGKDWMRDGIPTVGTGRGKRAVWATMVLSSIPLRFWNDRFGKESAELVAAIQQDDYAEDVLLSWTRSLCGFGMQSPRDTAWAEVLWQVAVDLIAAKKGKSVPEDLHRLASLVQVMPGAIAERKIEPFLRGELKYTQALALTLPVLPRPWSPGFAQAYLRQARQVLKSAPVDQAYEWLKTLEPAARALPRGSFAAALAPWDAERPGEKSWTASAIAQAVDRFTDLVRVRQSFYEELQKAISFQPSALSQQLIADR